MRKFILLAILATSLNAFGFGDLGHSTIGHIAEINLSSSGKAFISAFMGGEPLAISAIFPDQVRNDSRYDSFAPYHFFDFPQNVNYQAIPANLVAARSADTILIMAPELLTRRRIDTLQKQVIFRYYVHILGDVHQPLHVGNTLDRGANLCDVIPQDGKKINLHSFMDSTVVDYLKDEVLARAKEQGKFIKYFSYRDFAEYLLAEAKENRTLERLRAQIKKTKRVDWFEESRALHITVYPDGKTVVPQDRQYCKTINAESGKVEEGKYDSSKIPVLTKEYTQEVVMMIKNQILLGGLRLQSEIEKMATVRFNKKWSKKDEERFFRGIMPEKDLKKRMPSSQINKNDHHKECEH